MEKEPRHVALLVQVLLVIGLITVPVAASPPPSEGESHQATDWLIGMLDGSREVGYAVSVAKDPITGHTYVSYYDGVNGDLWLARTGAPIGNCGPGYMWQCVLADFDGIVGKYSSIAVGGPGPVAKLYITYHDVTTGSLKVLDGSVGRNSGSLSFHTYVIDRGDPGSGLLIGTKTSVDITAAGAPHIGYQVDLGAAKAIKYATRVADGTGNCGEAPFVDSWQCDSVQLDFDIGEFIDTDVGPGGVPNIAFFTDNAPDTHPMIATYVGSGGSCNSSDEWQCAPILRPNYDRGRYLAFHIANDGTKHLAYRNDTSESVEWARYVGPGAGNCGPGAGDSWQCEWIDDVGPEPLPSGIAMVTDPANHPVIAYQSGSSGFQDLKIARPYVVTDWNPTPNCGPIDLFHTWVCETLDEADLSHAEAVGGLAIAVNPQGEAAVAYRELFDPIISPVEGRLKMAMEPGLPFAHGFEFGDTSGWTASVP
jgi:hypothetical protein